MKNSLERSKHRSQKTDTRMMREFRKRGWRIFWAALRLETMSLWRHQPALLSDSFAHQLHLVQEGADGRTKSALGFCQGVGWTYWSRDHWRGIPLNHHAHAHMPQLARPSHLQPSTLPPGQWLPVGHDQRNWPGTKIILSLQQVFSRLWGEDSSLTESDREQSCLLGTAFTVLSTQFISVRNYDFQKLVFRWNFSP